MPDEKQPAAEPSPENEPGNTVPFVPPDAYSINPHLLARVFRPNAAALDTNSQVLPPLPLRTTGRSVLYVDFGFTSAQEFWDELVLPAYEDFQAAPTRRHAITAAWAAWHIQDWIWHQQHPGEDTRNNTTYQQFQQQLFASCPELPWIHDVADAGKHCGLGRQSVEVRAVKSTYPRNAIPLTMTLDDGTQHDFADVLEHVIEFWRAKYFPSAEFRRRREAIVHRKACMQQSPNCRREKNKWSSGIISSPDLRTLGICFLFRGDS